MITRDNLSKMLFFDIETAGAEETFKDKLQKDPEGAHIFEKKVGRLGFNDVDSGYFVKSGLFPEFGRIVCVSYGMWVNGEIRIATVSDESERDICQKIANLFHTAYTKDYVPVGWNIKNYDVPWLFRKMLMHGIQVPYLLNSFGKKPWEMNLIDLKEMWKGGSNLDVTFEEACYAMGIANPKNVLGGENVHGSYHEGDLPTIVEYCEADVRSMIQLVEKIHNVYANPIVKNA